PADERTDVYAVGLLVHRLLLGAGPFDRRRFLSLLSPGERSSPAEEIATRMPVELAGVVSRALAIEPEERFRSADGLAGARAIWGPAPGGGRQALLGCLAGAIAPMPPRPISRIAGRVG